MVAILKIKQATRRTLDFMLKNIEDRVEYEESFKSKTYES